jgi:hypothetical protein
LTCISLSHSIRVRVDLTSFLFVVFRLVFIFIELSLLLLVFSLVLNDFSCINSILCFVVSFCCCSFCLQCSCMFKQQITKGMFFAYLYSTSSRHSLLYVCSLSVTRTGKQQRRLASSNQKYPVCLPQYDQICYA